MPNPPSTEISADPSARRSPFFWVPTLYFAEGLPFYAVALIAGQMFKSLGVENGPIARWTRIVGLAWAFKPLWSPLLERFRTKKRVVVAFELAGACALGLVALSLHLPMWFAAAIVALGLVSLSGATHDIAADGVYIASLTARQQAQFAGWQGAFFNAAKFIAMGGLVILAGQLEKLLPVEMAWTIIFLIAAAILAAIGAYHLFALPQGRNPVAGDDEASDVWRSFAIVVADFFRKPGIWIAILFIVLFRAGEGQIQTIGPLFLRDARASGGLGLGTDQVGLIYGTAGTAAFLVGSVLGGYFTSWLGLRRAMPALILAVNLPNLAYYYLGAVQPESLQAITAALAAEMFGYGFGFVGVILFMMQVVAPGRFQTAHYALGTGVMQLGFLFFGGISGDIQAALGYRTFFLWVLLAAIPVLVLSFLIPMKPLTPADATTGRGEPTGG